MTTNNPDKNGQGPSCRRAQFWPSLFAAAAAARAVHDAQDERDVARCMPGFKTSGAKGGRRSRKNYGEIVIDPDDKNDQAFDLVANYGVPIVDASKYTDAPISYLGLWKRLSRHKFNQNLRAKENGAAQVLVGLMSATPSGGSGGGEQSTVTPRSATASKGQGKGRTSPPTDLGIVTFPSSPKPLYNKEAAAVDATIDSMPGWVNKPLVRNAARSKKRRTGKSANEKNFNDKAKKTMRDARYSRAFKLATKEAQDFKMKGESGKRGKGLRSIANRYNLSHLDQPDDRKLRPTNIFMALENGHVGVSPPKQGRPRKIPNAVTNQLAMQAAMMQASGQGEATTSKLTKALTAATTGTKHEGTFNSKYVVERARRDHPHIFQPKQAITNDDRRVEWLTFKNINDWTNAAKKELIDLGVVIDKPGFISKLSFSLSSFPCTIHSTSVVFVYYI